MGPFQSEPHREDDAQFDGRRVPSEAEWLHLPVPDELLVSPDFVEHTLRAMRDNPAADGTALDRALAGAELPAELLRAFAPPEPAPDFVHRTMLAVHSDRRARWHELLARHVAPDPSPEFVARTLASLAMDRRRLEASELGARRPRVWTRWWPLLAIAAAALLWFAPWTQPRDPLELRLAHSEPAAFASSYAPTPLPAVFASLSHDADPGALSDAGADGVWLLLGRKP